MDETKGLCLLVVEEMTPQERAAIICSLLNFKPVSRQDADNFDAVVKEIEEAEREAFIHGQATRVQMQADEVLNLGFEKGFNAAREKAFDIAAIVNSQLANRILDMEADK